MTTSVLNQLKGVSRVDQTPDPHPGLTNAYQDCSLPGYSQRYVACSPAGSHRAAASNSRQSIAGQLEQTMGQCVAPPGPPQAIA